jgi:hypothetical protein
VVQVTVLENVLDPSHLPFTHHLTISNRAAAGPVHLRVVANGQTKNKIEDKAVVDTQPEAETTMDHEEVVTGLEEVADLGAASPAATTATAQSRGSGGGGIGPQGFAAVRWRPGTDSEPPLTANPARGNSSGVVFKAPHLVVSSTVRPDSFTDWNVVRYVIHI